MLRILLLHRRAISGARGLTVAAIVSLLLGAGCDSADNNTVGNGGAGSADAGGGTPSNTASAGGHAGHNQGGAGGSTTSAGGNAAGGAGAAGGANSWQSNVATLSDRHRFIDGAMFGGWGPHLGHMLRGPKSAETGDTLWFVDDYCTQSAANGAVCNVNNNHSLGYFEFGAGQWSERHVVSIPGSVQQNTASIIGSDNVIYSYGLDIGAGVIHECRYAAMSGPLGCNALGFATGADANYIGAGVSPQGHRLVWWTNVVDGGGGSFHYIINYGGGWNGPRSGDVAGYNDAAYINIAFGGASANAFTLHAQMVSGLAPNWSFFGLVGYGDMGTSDAVTWSNALAPPQGDPVISTNDVFTDEYGGTHLLARLNSATAAYYYRPIDGTWSGASYTEPAAYRARWLTVPGKLALVYGQPDGTLHYRIATTTANTAIDWTQVPDIAVALPANFGQVFGIYPESHAYQNATPTALNLAVVGSTAQHQLLHVSLTSR